MADKKPECMCRKIEKMPKEEPAKIEPTTKPKKGFWKTLGGWFMLLEEDPKENK